MARTADLRPSEQDKRTSQTRYRDCPPDTARASGGRGTSRRPSIASMRSLARVSARRPSFGRTPGLRVSCQRWRPCSGGRPSRSGGRRAAGGRPCPRPRRPTPRSARRSRSPARNRRARPGAGSRSRPRAVRTRVGPRGRGGGGHVRSPRSTAAPGRGAAPSVRAASAGPARPPAPRGSTPVGARAVCRPGTTPAPPPPAVAPARTRGAGPSRRPRRRGSRRPRPGRRGYAPAPVGSRRPPAARDRRRTPSPTPSVSRPGAVVGDDDPEVAV